jgi:hypothetical protein
MRRLHIPHHTPSALNSSPRGTEEARNLTTKRTSLISFPSTPDDLRERTVWWFVSARTIDTISKSFQD